MIWQHEIKYSHRIGERNVYNAYYKQSPVGIVAWTPKARSPWTFTSSDKKVQTFGSTRMEAIRGYLENYYLKRGEV